MASDDAMPARSVIDYELAGRLPSQTFRDLRSASKARRHHRAYAEKYYSHRYVNAGQIGRQHQDIRLETLAQQNLPSESPVFTMTKQELYREAQRYPRPPAMHRRPREYARWSKTCRQDKIRHARRHQFIRLQDDVQEARDPWFMAEVVGYADDDRYYDDHVFRRCDVCWPEMQGWWIKDEMFDSNGDAVGQLEPEWGVPVCDGGNGRFGFAGRAKTGALFLMGEEDWTGQIVNPYDEDVEWDDEDYGWYENEDGPVDEAPHQDDQAPIAESWDELHSQGTGSDDWDVLSTCSSWSHVSK